jgi:hypothetical protein
LPSFTNGHDNLKDIKVGKTSHLLVCPPKKNRFLWMERIDKFSKTGSNVGVGYELTEV